MKNKRLLFFIFFVFISFSPLYSKDKEKQPVDNSLTPIKSNDLFYKDEPNAEAQSINPKPLPKKSPIPLPQSLLESHNAEKVALLSEEKAISAMKKEVIIANEVFFMRDALKMYKKGVSIGIITDDMLEDIFDMLKDEHYCQFYINEASEGSVICNKDFTSFLFSSIYTEYDKNLHLKDVLSPSSFMLLYIGAIDKLIYLHKFKVRSIILKTLINTKISFISEKEARRINFE